MDEPTNDLDAETLELLEELLLNFEGTLLLVSHDREFMDNVVSSTISFEGNGLVREYVGGYQDWLRQGGKWPERTKTSAVPATATQTPKQPEPVLAPVAVAAKQKKLSYKLQRELEMLPQQIETLENAIEAAQLETTAPDFYQRSHAETTAKLESIAALTLQLEACFERWQALEAMQNGEV